MLRNVAVSERLVEAMQQQQQQSNTSFPSFLANVTCGFGFLNFFVDHRILAEVATNSILKSPALVLPAAQRKRVAVDFSSPNIAKEMHVGHLRSTIIGETICRVLTSCGHDVLRINHVGDWGTQFGMLLCHLNDNHPNFHEKTPDISNLNTFYKEAKKRFDDEPDFKERSRLMVPQLQGGDVRALAGWRALYDVSKMQFSQVYERLDVTCELFGESEYNRYDHRSI